MRCRRIGFCLVGGFVALAAGGGAVAYTTAGASPQPVTPPVSHPLRVVRVKEVKSDATASE